MYKNHPIYEQYAADKNGKIINTATNKVLKQYKSHKGYLLVSINNKIKNAHRFVYECFNGIIPEGMVIDHINTIRDDNRLENLRCVSARENSRNPITIQHLKEGNLKRSKGVICKNKKDEIIGYYPSIRDASRDTGVAPSTIRRHIKGKTRKNGPYVWEEADCVWVCKWGKWWKTL